MTVKSNRHVYTIKTVPQRQGVLKLLCEKKEKKATIYPRSLPPGY